jgi:hypothetical protein
MATYSDTVLTDAPLSYLHFDEATVTSSSTLTDYGSAGGTATVSGDTNILTARPAAGTIPGSSFHFNNNVGYVQHASLAPQSANWTVEFWYKRDTGYAASVNNGNVFQTSGGAKSLQVAIGSGGNVLTYVGGTLVNNGGASFNDGAWHHIAVTQSGTSVQTYVDGVLKVSGTGSTTSNTTGYTIQWGSPQAGTGSACYLDEPAFYNKALTLAQIQAHYTAGTTVPSVSVTQTPQYFAVGPLTTVAPAVTAVQTSPNAIIAVPAMTGSLATATPVVTVSSNVMDAVPAMTLSLATPTATSTASTNLAETASAGSIGASGSYWRFGYGNSASYQFGNVSVPAGKRIQSAILTLSASNTTGAGNATPGHVFGYQIDRFDTTFNGSVNLTHESTGTVTAPAVNAIATWTIDITNIVKDWSAGATNAGIHMAWNPTGSTSTTTEYVALSDTTGTKPYIAVVFEDIPPTNINVIAPVMTANIADPAPVVTAQRNVSATAAIVDLGTVDLVAASASAVFKTPNVSNTVAPFGADISTVDPSASAYGNAIVQAPAVQASLSFLGGASFNPDFVAAATAIAAGIATPNANQFIEYNVLVQAPVTYFGNLENEPVNINLTTNRLTVAPPMSLSLKWPGIYIEGADRYLTKIAKTVDYDDIWYKMDEASGNRAIDSVYGGPSAPSSTLWTQSGYYFGNPTFRISDGPELRPAVHFDGIDDYMVVGPYTQDNKYVDGDPDDVESLMAVTIEFSIRTTQKDGVVFIGGGAGIAGLAQISPSYYSLPHVNGNELRLENGYLTIANGSGTKIKARTLVSDGQWHHIVMSIPSGEFAAKNPSDPIQFDGRIPSYLAVDGQPTLVRYGNFLGDTQSWGNYWLPYIVGARTNDVPWDNIANNKTKDVGASGFLAMDMRDFIVRLNAYQQLKDTEVIYYEWSNSTVLNPEPMTVNVSTIDPFKVKGNMKKMLALYGLPWGYDEYGTMPLYTYASTLSGMAIRHFGDSGEHVPNGSTFNGHSPVYQKVKTFTIGDYLVYPVDLTGGAQNGGFTGSGGDSTYATDVTSVPGVIDRSAPFMKEYPDGTGYGGFADDTTGLPRFINLQTDLVDVKDFDLITAVNYPWETPMNVGSVGNGFYRQPPEAQLCQSSMGMSVSEWTVARNKLRDSILQAAYDGASLWIGEYHMAQHLGFIGHYDMHDFGQLDGTWDGHARDLDKAHGVDSSGYLGLMGEYVPEAQLMYDRRVTALVPGLTDLPTTELGDHIAGWSYDRWKANGDFVAADLVRRPNGLQIGDQARMCGDGFVGAAATNDIPFVQSGQNYGWFNGSVIALADGNDTFDGRNYLRQHIISAHPDEVVGTPVTREMTGYYGRAGVWVDNPYKDNVLTIAAEVGTVVRGKAIAGRAFIELMEIAISPTMVTETQPLPANQQTQPGVVLRYSPSSFTSTWEYDTRRNREVMATLNNSMLKAIGGGMGFQVVSNSINYMSFTDAPVIYHRRETMHSRGLNWLAQTRELNAGDVAVYQTAFLLTLTEPSPNMTRTSNPVVQVTSAMRLDAEVRQPKNYLTGDVEVRTLPAEMTIDMRGRGVVNTATVMTIGLSTPGPIALAAAEMIAVFVDSDNGPTTLFLKEDN